PTTNATFDLIEGLFADLNDIFPEKLMHLGGDEVNTDCWTNTKEVADWMADNDMDASSTYAWFIAKVQHIAQNLGKEVIGWEEIWNNFGTQLDPKTIVHLWISGSKIAPAVTAAGYRMLWSSSDKWYGAPERG
ncbi:hypothetical protein TeGR_g4241, partial [Tetraparma gracilis]